MSIAEKIKEFHAIVPPDVEIVAVSKFHPAEMIMEAYEAGQKCFGESRVQEFLEKEAKLPKDIKWHFIGHLQTNKVKPLIGKISIIESVDSPRLLRLINDESEKKGVITNVLLQIHVAAEEAKFGFYPQELRDYLGTKEYETFKSLRICGLMGMATNTDDEERVIQDFSSLHELFLEIRDDADLKLPDFKFLSMGMSGDWPLAVKEGANIIRIGSAIFGNRY